MKITINNREITLNNQEVKSAKNMVSRFISNIKQESERSGQPTYLFTSLIIMHIMSEEMLDEIDAKTLEYLMNQIEESRIRAKFKESM